VSRSSVREGLLAPVSADRAVRWYRRMVFIRRFEEAAQALFLRGQIRGSIHLSMGQEAVSVGAVEALGKIDLVASTYRGHAQALALGVDPRQFMAELLGRPAGLCGGRAGSMNIVSRTNRLIGCFGIVGGSVAAATGAALTLKQRGEGVAVAFFGDGALNQGYFHECINFASVLKLPLVLICENNLYGEFTPMAAVTAGTPVARAMSYGIRAIQCDGNDVWAVHTAASDAVSYAQTDGPVFMEALTYRFNDHARGDPIDYRPEGELERWRQRDPLTLAERRLALEHGFTSTSLNAIREEEAARVVAVRDAALQEAVHDVGTWTATQFEAGSEEQSNE
jgi:acetoin:2,6-dichlorophenolindophenol oxidoreductase subunit alpha